MPGRSHDSTFRELVSVERPRLFGVAYLMSGEPARAEELVQASLASLYGRWPEQSGRSGRPGEQSEGRAEDDGPRLAALRLLLHARPGQVVLPWQRGERFELTDAPPRSDLPPGIVADLAALDPTQRRTIICERYLQLPTTAIARLLDLDVAEVHAAAQRAAERLALGDPTRRTGQVLTEQLLAAVAAVEGTSRDQAYAVAPPAVVEEDLAHGRFLLRRRRLRLALGAMAGLVAVLLAGSQLVPLLRPAAGSSQVAPPAVSQPAASGAASSLGCDPRRPACRVRVIQDWRQQMSEVAGHYVDPEEAYFSGFTYSYDRRYDSAGVWDGRGGALGLDLFRLSGGATEVYLQIATSSAYAVPCGRTTHTRCASMRFMDGNVFTLSDSTLVSPGVEVQYCPRGDQVITVVARNTMKGKALNITRGQLIALVQDERLRLPPL